MKSKSSFTVLELVIVVIIIAAISGLAITGSQKVFRVAAEQRAALNLKALHSANEMYEAREVTYWNTYNSTKDVDDINSVLKPGIVAGNTTYTYVSAAYSGGGDPRVYTYTADATVTRYGFGVRIRPGKIFNAAAYPTNPCCFVGTCPTIANCSNNGVSVCGNNIIESGEQCDDGNTSGGDGCDEICLIE